MQIEYYYDSCQLEAEINDRMKEIIKEFDREEENQSRKFRYHCYSYDAIAYEGLDYADTTDPYSELEKDELMREIQGAMNLLSNIQKRRFLMYAEGKSMNEIARLEDVNPNAVWKSIVSARKKLKKYLQKGV